MGKLKELAVKNIKGILGFSEHFFEIDGEAMAQLVEIVCGGTRSSDYYYTSGCTDIKGKRKAKGPGRPLAGGPDRESVRSPPRTIVYISFLPAMPNSHKARSNTCLNITTRWSHCHGSAQEL